MLSGCKYGTHRVITPKGVLPQPAQKIDNTPQIYANEILIDVDILNITSTAFSRIKKLAGGKPGIISEEVLRIVGERGKFQCPDTGSGGMLVGTVAEIGSELIGKTDLKIGDRIATMVSLALTPLFLSEIVDINIDTDQVFVKGKAILFESGIYARIPSDLPETLSVAVMDVAGAPAWTAKYTVAGQIVTVIGAGKAGLLCLHEAKKRAGVTGKVIMVDPSPGQCELVRKLQLADVVLQIDATDPMQVVQAVGEATGGKMSDFVINTANVANTEMSSILACREYGKVLFFSMSTNFSKAALGCEGVGKELTLLIGTGYTDGHDAITLQILRENPGLRAYFESIYK